MAVTWTNFSYQYYYYRIIQTSVSKLFFLNHQLPSPVLLSIATFTSMKIIIEFTQKYVKFIQYLYIQFLELMLPQENVYTHNCIGRYVILSKIEEGSQSIVFLARKEDKFYGVKVYKNVHDGRKFFDRQMSILCCIDDQMIVKPLQISANDVIYQDHECKSLTQPFLVMNFYRKGDLRRFMNLGAIPLKIRNYLIKSLVKCLLATQMHGIIHGDIKPENFLIDENFTLKLIDFGMAMRVGEQEQQLVGTKNYIAPQIYKDKKYSYKSDIFALGVICFELVFSEKHAFPFKEAKISDCNFLLLKQKMYDRFWSKFHTTEIQPQIMQLLQKMLAANPEERPLASKIVSSNWFQETATVQQCQTFYESSISSSKMS